MAIGSNQVDRALVKLRATDGPPVVRRPFGSNLLEWLLGRERWRLARRGWIIGTIVLLAGALSMLSGLMDLISLRENASHACFRAASWFTVPAGQEGLATRYQTVGWIVQTAATNCESKDEVAAAQIERKIEARFGQRIEAQMRELKQVSGSMQQALAMTSAENARLRETIDKLVANAPPALRAQLREGNTDAGVDYYQRRADAKQEKDKVEASRALVFAATLELFKDTSKAIADLTRAIALDGDNGDALALRALVLQRTGDMAGAERDLGTLSALAGRANRPDWNGNALAKLGILSYVRGDLDRAHGRFAEALAIEKALGRKPGIAEGYTNVGVVALARGDLRSAEQSLITALETTQDLDTSTADAERHQKNSTAAVLTNLGRLFAAQGEFDRADRMHAKALSLHEETRNRPGQAEDFLHLGNIAYQKAALPEAEGMYQRALVIADEMQDREQQAVLLGNLGTIASRRGDNARATDLFRRALAINERLGRRLGIAHQNANLGMAAEAAGDIEAACSYRRTALELYGQLGQQSSVQSMRRWVETCDARRTVSGAVSGDSAAAAPLVPAGANTSKASATKATATPASGQTGGRPRVDAVPAGSPVAAPARAKTPPRVIKAQP